MFLHMFVLRNYFQKFLVIFREGLFEWQLQELVIIDTGRRPSPFFGSSQHRERVAGGVRREGGHRWLVYTSKKRTWTPKIGDL